jgi:hypothetical protein
MWSERSIHYTSRAELPGRLISLKFKQNPPTAEHMHWAASAAARRDLFDMFRLDLAHAQFAFVGVGRISMQLLFGHQQKH